MQTSHESPATRWEVQSVVDNVVIVDSCKGHYDD